MTQPFRDTETKRAENISLKCLSVNHLQAFLGCTGTEAAPTVNYLPDVI
jgi:hypothetical protein